MFRRILIAAGLLPLLVVGSFAAVIAFNAPAAPPVLAAGNSIPGIAQWNFAELPKPQTVKARDGAPAAIANAVLDALRPLGVRHLDMPITAHKVWRALHAR